MQTDYADTTLADLETAEAGTARAKTRDLLVSLIPMIEAGFAVGRPRCVEISFCNHKLQSILQSVKYKDKVNPHKWRTDTEEWPKK